MSEASDNDFIEAFGRWTPLDEAQLRANREADWRQTLAEYLASPEDFYAAWSFLCNHPANRHPKHPDISMWDSNFDVMVVKVNPETLRIETHSGKGGADACPEWDSWHGCRCELDRSNTKTQVWIEWGPWYIQEATEHDEEWETRSHDPRTDTGGDTFEDAIVNLAHNVWHLYGERPDVGDDEELADAR